MNRVLLRLTKLHLWFVKGKYVGTQTIELPDSQKQEVVIYSGIKALFSGQSTFFQTIIIHQNVLGNQNLLNYVISHEIAHKRQWWRFLIFPLIFLMIALYGLTSEWYYIVLLVVIGLVFSWFIELNADFRAIKVIGFETYWEIMNNASKQKRSLVQKIIISLTHPPTEVTIRLWKWFHKREMGTKAG